MTAKVKVLLWMAFVSSLLVAALVGHAVPVLAATEGCLDDRELTLLNQRQDGPVITSRCESAPAAPLWSLLWLTPIGAPFIYGLIRRRRNGGANRSEPPIHYGVVNHQVDTPHVDGRVVFAGGTIERDAGGMPTSASFDVAAIELSTRSTDRWDASFEARALGASTEAKVGVWEEDGRVVKGIALGAEAHVAETKVGGGVRVGSVRLGVSGFVGLGAGGGLKLLMDGKSLAFSIKIGAGKMVGFGFAIAW